MWLENYKLEVWFQIFFGSLQNLRFPPEFNHNSLRIEFIRINLTNLSLFQTFHTPSFGDEEFDIPAINPQQQQAQQQQNHHGHQNHGDQQHYQSPMQSMQQMSQQNQQQDAMGMHDPTGGYQQPLYLSGPDHGMVNPSYHSPQSNYSLNQQQQQQQHNNQLLMIQQQQQQHQQMMMSHGQPPPGSMAGYGASPQHPQGRGNSPPAAPGQEHTTSDDSDDSTPHPAMVWMHVAFY